MVLSSESPNRGKEGCSSGGRLALSPKLWLYTNFDCNLRCSYCDTAYAFTEGKRQTLEDVIEEVRRRASPFRSSKSEVRSSEFEARRSAVPKLKESPPPASRYVSANTSSDGTPSRMTP